MSMIFPGMDPYLEDPQLWPGVHNRLIVYLADHLQPLLQPRYVAAMEDRVYVEGPQRRIAPDVWIRQAGREGPPADTPALPCTSTAAVAELDEPEVIPGRDLEAHESYIEILDLYSGQKVVTVIEVVSPANKFSGTGRDSYLTKQHEVMFSTSHLVEIDLLRIGQHTLAVSEWDVRTRGPYDYLISVSRAAQLRAQFEIYRRQLRQRLPRIRIPLAHGDPDVRLDLQAVLTQVYDAGSYRQRINYAAPCRPPLAPDEQAWADQLVRAAASAGEIAGQG